MIEKMLEVYHERAVRMEFAWNSFKCGMLGG